MASRLIHLLGVPHFENASFAEQLVKGLRADGVDVTLAIDHWLNDWTVHGNWPDSSRQQDIKALISSDLARVAIGNASSLMVIPHPLLNHWAMTHVFRLAAVDQPTSDLKHEAPEGLSELRMATLNLLLATPVVPGQWRDASGQACAHEVEDVLRKCMYQADIPYASIWGQGEARVTQALAVVRHALSAPTRTAPKWRWMCQDCDDGACEHEAFKLARG